MSGTGNRCGSQPGTNRAQRASGCVATHGRRRSRHNISAFVHVRIPFAPATRERGLGRAARRVSSTLRSEARARCAPENFPRDTPRRHALAIVLRAVRGRPNTRPPGGLGPRRLLRSIRTHELAGKLWPVTPQGFSASGSFRPKRRGCRPHDSAPRSFGRDIPRRRRFRPPASSPTNDDAPKSSGRNLAAQRSAREALAVTLRPKDSAPRRFDWKLVAERLRAEKLWPQPCRRMTARREALAGRLRPKDSAPRRFGRRLAAERLRAEKLRPGLRAASFPPPGKLSAEQTCATRSFGRKLSA
jgi:hypothetical protein